MFKHFTYIVIRSRFPRKMKIGSSFGMNNILSLSLKRQGIRTFLTSICMILCSDQSVYWFQKEVLKSRNKEVVQLFDHGIGIHHAGMLRQDRSLTEHLFSEGLLKVFFSNLDSMLIEFSLDVFPERYVCFRSLFALQPWLGGWICLLILLWLRYVKAHLLFCDYMNAMFRKIDLWTWIVGTLIIYV